jgi:uncharacterized protein YjbI with pentapeptide repeats
VADSNHLAELAKGVESWNEWRRQNPYIIPDLRKADFSSFNLEEANLNLADLSFAKLNEANLSRADLSNARLISAKFIKADLNDTNFSKAELKFASFQDANLIGANFSGTNLSEAIFIKASLRQANLSKAILSAANFNQANLNSANLSKTDLKLTNMAGANLQNADLESAQALGTNFEKANFTGACLQDWRISNKTNLDNIECDYIFLGKDAGSRFIQRFPANRRFQPGEFTAKFQRMSKSKEIFFENGITEFLQFFQKLEQDETDKVFSIQKMESKDHHGLLVSLEVLPEIDQGDAKRLNAEQFQLAKATYELQSSTQVIEMYKQQVVEMYKQRVAENMEIIRLLASRDINVEANAVSNSEQFTNNMQGASIANFANQVTGNARQQANQYNYAAETKSLAEAANEIQALLEQLSQIYPADSLSAKVNLAQETVRRIDANPALSQRLLSAFKAGGVSALGQFLNHPVATFVISALEDWQKTHQG